MTHSMIRVGAVNLQLHNTNNTDIRALIWVVGLLRLGSSLFNILTKIPMNLTPHHRDWSGYNGYHLIVD